MGKNLTLTGMMGVGKSTVGKNLAKKLKYNFIDVDKLIENKEGVSINMIFKSKVSALLLNDEERKDNRSRPRYTEAVKTNAAKAPTASNFPMNSASYDESGMTLPENLLEAPLENSEDFSVFFRANPSGGVNNIGIEFGVEEDGTSEKD